MISWAGRESLTISDFSSLTCDQAVLRFSHFLWEAWSQVISIFATYISSPTDWERRREVSRHRISEFRLLAEIYSTLCISWVRVRVENYGYLRPWFVGGMKRNISSFFSRLLQPEAPKSWPWKLLPRILIFLVNRIIWLCKNNIKLSAAVGLIKWSYKQPSSLLTVVGVKRISRIERLQIAWTHFKTG